MRPERVECKIRDDVDRATFKQQNTDKDWYNWWDSSGELVPISLSPHWYCTLIFLGEHLVDVRSFGRSEIGRRCHVRFCDADGPKRDCGLRSMMQQKQQNVTLSKQSMMLKAAREQHAAFLRYDCNASRLVMRRCAVQKFPLKKQQNHRALFLVVGCTQAPLIMSISNSLKQIASHVLRQQNYLHIPATWAAKAYLMMTSIAIKCMCKLRRANISQKPALSGMHSKMIALSVMLTLVNFPTVFLRFPTFTYWIRIWMWRIWKLAPSLSLA